MNVFFSLLEQLVALTVPSLVVLQNLLGVPLTPMPTENKYWHFYQAKPATGLIARVDYREPRPGAAKSEPFLVLYLRDAPIRTDDIWKRYGPGHPTDVSVHHPGFIGYSFRVHDVPVGLNADSKNQAVLSVSIDYSDRTVTNAVPASPSARRPGG